MCCVHAGELWRVQLLMEHPGYINASFANVHTYSNSTIFFSGYISALIVVIAEYYSYIAVPLNAFKSYCDMQYNIPHACLIV